MDLDHGSAKNLNIITLCSVFTQPVLQGIVYEKIGHFWLRTMISRNINKFSFKNIDLVFDLYIFKTNFLFACFSLLCAKKWIFK